MKSKDLNINKKYLILKDYYGQKDFYEIEVLYKAKNAIKLLFTDDNQKIWYSYEDFDVNFNVIEELI